eukprot:Hpha_TRINITY_DN36068_c0_g1::TRINITY_DN36068_c0_g1_i1::g.170890::m.170890
MIRSAFIMMIAAGGVSLAQTLQPLCVGNFSGSPPPVFINCSLERGGPTSGVSARPMGDGKSVYIMEYNIDRNAQGGDGHREQGLGKIIELLSGNITSAGLPSPDILVLSEVARGCKPWGGVNVSGAEVIAKALGMAYWAYGVEYVDLDWSASQGSECTIGNALVSKYPITHADQLRFATQCCRYGGRAGGRMAVIGDITVTPEAVPLRIASAHLESGKSIDDLVQAEAVRAAQGKELGVGVWQTPSGVPWRRVNLVAGDLNSPLLEADPTIIALETFLFKDAHRHLPIRERETVTDGAVGGVLGNCDYILSTNDTALQGAGICEDPSCRGWSDHVPIYARVDLPRA